MKSNNLSPIRSIIKNSAILLCVKASLPIANLVVTILVARLLGVKAFGIFAIVFVFQNIFRLLSLFGLDALLIREIAKKEERADIFLGNAYIFGIFSSFINMIMMNVVLFIANYPTDIRLCGFIASLSLLADALTMFGESAFIAMRKNFYMLFTVAGKEVFKIIAVSAALFVQREIASVLIALTLTSFVGFIINLIILRFYAFKPRLLPIKDIMQGFMKTSPTIALINVASTFFLSIGVIVLSKIEGDIAVGLYNAAFKFIFIAFLFIDSIGMTLLPIFSKLYHSSIESFKRLGELVIKYLIISAIFFIVFIIFYARPLVTLIYGDKFLNAIPILQIMAWSILFLGASYFLAKMLLASNLQRYDLAAMLTASAVNLAVSVILIRQLGVTGAAYGVLVSTIALFLINGYFFSKKVNKVNFMETIFKPVAIGAIPFIIASHYLSHISVYFGFMLSSILYLLLLIAFKIVRAEEIERLRECLKA